MAISVVCWFWTEEFDGNERRASRAAGRAVRWSDWLSFRMDSEVEVYEASRLWLVEFYHQVKNRNIPMQNIGFFK